MNITPERREAKRIPFYAKAFVSNGARSVMTDVHNLSLSGILLNRPVSLDVEKHIDDLSIDITVDRSINLHMRLNVVRLTDTLLAGRWSTIDPLSLSHLEKIVDRP